MDRPDPLLKLEKYLLLAKSARSIAVTKLIEEATAAPGVHVFAELIDLPNVQELAGTENEKWLELLRLFSWGTYQDYKARAASLPPLNDAQLTKLKHLSICSLALESRSIPYTTLQVALDIPNIRQLEDLVIDAIYEDILLGKLDQRRQILEVEYTMGRDLAPGRAEDILETLQEWSNTTSQLLQSLSDTAKSATVAHDAARRAAEQADAERDKVLREIQGKLSGGGSTAAGGKDARWTDAMEVDPVEEGGPMVPKGKKKASQNPPHASARKRNRN